MAKARTRRTGGWCCACMSRETRRTRCARSPISRRSATSISPPEHELEIVDLLKHPQRALADGIIVTPTLLKLLPLPVQRVIGNLSDTNQVLLTLAGK